LALTGQSALAHASYMGSARARALTRARPSENAALNCPTLPPACGPVFRRRWQTVRTRA